MNTILMTTRAFIIHYPGHAQSEGEPWAIGNTMCGVIAIAADVGPLRAERGMVAMAAATCAGRDPSLGCAATIATKGGAVGDAVPSITAVEAALLVCRRRPEALRRDRRRRRRGA